MDNNIDNLKKLIEALKTIGFWKRLFGWKAIREKLVDAVADMQKLISNAENLSGANSILENEKTTLTSELRIANESMIKQSGELTQLKSNLESSNSRITQLTADLSSSETTITNQTETINQLNSDKRLLNETNTNLVNENKRLSGLEATNTETITNLTGRKSELEIELSGIKEKLTNIENELSTVKQQNTQLLADEDNRREKYETEMSTLTSVREQIQSERAKEIAARNNEVLERLKNLKETWNKHQEYARNSIKNICNRHTVEYVDKVPFKGEPDNTLRICEEYVIFDAKSPATDDLTNFPNYLKDQAEKAKKYAKQEDVKPDIFFVVPTNTLEVLKQFVFNLGDYNVFVISVDSLEQIILSLKKIEEYEFAEQLSPEERDNICRVLGKFAHLTKRRIQIDSFFAKQFIELAYKTETSLPKEIFEKVVEFEKSEKLNPPIEKRAKAINIKELEKDTTKINSEANLKGIVIDDAKISTGLNELQLYKPECE